MRTLVWIAQQKDMKDIFVTSDLTGVSGGSIGFTLEAMWYGFQDKYVYTGSSSPATGWLPSYDLAAGLAIKAQIP